MNETSKSELEKKWKSIDSDSFIGLFLSSFSMLLGASFSRDAPSESITHQESGRIPVVLIHDPWRHSNPPYIDASSRKWDSILL